MRASCSGRAAMVAPQLTRRGLAVAAATPVRQCLPVQVPRSAAGAASFLVPQIRSERARRQSTVATAAATEAPQAEETFQYQAEVLAVLPRLFMFVFPAPKLMYTHTRTGHTSGWITLGYEMC